MVTITNTSLNTATITNSAQSAQTATRTWADMVLTWAEYPGDWAFPQDLSNQSLHTGTLTNNTYSE
jgi:hypothetical protein